ncbi:PLP-dependent cysteine synthase family protein [Streptococcus gallolyticus]|uniref:PLP-dependent cysteine synthase family protein n=1 Tax=Streptococcus gallolyticus TaxID=315405 RepID=UPI002283CE5D|nr:PLP-dependent cysteine synthase family protein [Streptococcus gallolyticus]MCY7185432.1 PLP-dependent cysteine synthase family protein [Streptococcus gallolyticus subsp. gallolyticus]MCY7189535.1 PLP-dependent cysteine synthase family protein [Streptococcus gallolyticus subsp. gallolyticus]
MAKIYDSITELVGNTPLVHLQRYEKSEGLSANILGKFEYFNPSGSVKDRAALNIIEEAEKRGDIKPGMTLVDYTSGNTGIGEATFANAKGYKFVAVIQPQVSVERSQILKALGAEVLQVTDVPGFPELLKNGLTMTGLEKVFTDFAKANGWYYLNQCADINNTLAHVKTTGPEIWEATGGKVDYVVQLVGTGGTLSGLAKYFREKNPDVKIIGAQPAEISKKDPNFPERNTIDGVLNFDGVPEANYPPLFTSFDTKYDECFDVVAEDAYETGRRLVKEEGFFLGQSAGAALWTATQIAKRPEAKGKNIIVILADNAFKYLSTNMYK